MICKRAKKGCLCSHSKPHKEDIRISKDSKIVLNLCKIHKCSKIKDSMKWNMNEFLKGGGKCVKNAEANE
jgi:hypothetical protein